MVQPAIAAAKTRGYRLDWMLVTMTLVAVLLLAATTIRTSGSGVDLSDDQQSGLRLLTPQEQLLVFEDFRFDARGWSPAQRDIVTATRGASLGHLRLKRCVTRCRSTPARRRSTGASILHFQAIGAMRP